MSNHQQTTVLNNLKRKYSTTQPNCLLEKINFTSVYQYPVGIIDCLHVKLYCKME